MSPFVNTPLDDCLYALQSSIPHLTRSSLHRLFAFGDLRFNATVSADYPNWTKKTRKEEIQAVSHRIFCLRRPSAHIDIAEVRTEEGVLYLFVAVDRTSKFVYTELLEKYGKMRSAQFLRNLLAAVPYKIHTILTDNGQQFTNLELQRHAFPHIFDRVCQEHNIEHRRTQPAHPWTNGQVERMIKPSKKQL